MKKLRFSSALRVVAAIIMAVALCAPCGEAKRKPKKAKKKAKTTLVSSGKAKDHPLDSPENRFVTVAAPFGPPSEGLDGRNIALWQSHGRIFDNGQGVWKWQRPRLFGTVEDLFSQGFVVPYLAPMLENAGAYVMLPRERDTAPWEVIADEDGSPEGRVHFDKGKHKWETTHLGSGFALRRTTITDGENPFTMGTARKAKTVEPKDAGKASRAAWYASLPEAGRRAVYVSYPSFDNSATDAQYVVNHLGGQTAVTVNQRMGGGTWVYIGTYDLPAGEQRRPVVELSNVSAHHGGKAVVGADAVRIGGGMGRTARAQTDPSGTMLTEPFTSASPRFNEGARYWLQWAGMPQKVYNPNASTNDYRDDLMSRANWVNYLAGGSRQLPDSAGLRIPLDMALAIHTDAGRRDDSTTIGTLGLFSSDDGHPLGNRRNRADCRDLAQTVQRQVVADLRALYTPDWGDRGVKDQKYHECRAPRVPSAIIEMLSHQNLQDMRYGLEPQVRFDVSRAIYKGVLRFLGRLYGKKVTVQPLPVDAFAIDYDAPGRYRLSWRPTPDPLEPSARPTAYIVEHRADPDGGFEPLTQVADTSYMFETDDTDVHSFRIVAVNAGGRSFPSEVLALGDNGQRTAPDLLIVNGFTRLSAPDLLGEQDGAGVSRRGFDLLHGEGTDLRQDIISTGPQHDFFTGSEFVDNDLPGFGNSHANLEREVTGGNTLDYAAVHGRSALGAGRSFVSSSLRGFALGDTLRALPPVVDLILGTQRELAAAGGNPLRPTRFKAFPADVQQRLGRHLDRGGKVVVSGAHAASDLWANTLSGDSAARADRDFAANRLHVGLLNDDAALLGCADGAAGTPFAGFRYDFSLGLSPELYPIGRVDALRPANGGRTLLRYGENQFGAAVGSPQTLVMAFPFEAVTDPGQRDRLMKQIFNYFYPSNP